METKDLMIGDWVLYNPNVFIEDEYESPKDCYPTKISCGEDIDLAIEDCYSPIHLTPEILEKNFLVQRGEWTEPVLYFFSNDYIDISIKEYTDGIWEVVVDEVEKGVLPTWKMYVSNVHELQHALKLCGIDKEIEI